MQRFTFAVLAACAAVATTAGATSFVPASDGVPKHAKSWVADILPEHTAAPTAVRMHNCLDQYPKDAKARHIEGVTSLAFRVAEDGTVKNVKVRKSSGNAALDKAAVACVKGWTYTPAHRDLKPVEVAWRFDMKWVVLPEVQPITTMHPPPSSATDRVVPKAVPPPDIVIQKKPPVNTITIQIKAVAPPPISMPASVGAPHVCIGDYPPEAVAELSEGTTTVEFMIGTDGHTKDVVVSQSSGFVSLDDAAVTCASRWMYKPAMQEGKPVEVPWKAEVRWLFQ